jgi:4-hydroxy-tetrahydrodipicolinate synthase
VCRAIFSSLRQGRLSSARQLERRLLTLEACLIRPNPAALKYALSLLGLIDSAPRLPLVELDDSAKAEVARALGGMAEDDFAATAQAR